MSELQKKCAACGTTAGHLRDYRASGGKQKIISLCANKVACDRRAKGAAT